MGFETTTFFARQTRGGRCKFTPLGFETTDKALPVFHTAGVNLPRWGLKPQYETRPGELDNSVNLPRWGLKLQNDKIKIMERILCKFTPLGFETLVYPNLVRLSICVNLPRWGLKRSEERKVAVDKSV